MEKILSILVPTFNMEKFLDNCLSSFLIKEILDDIEVLIVNDGSTDSSVDIAKKYVIKYPNSFKLINKENAGHGSTINKGIEIAKGKYFKVVDADDWVEEEAFLDLVNTLKKYDVDLVLSNFFWRNVKTGKLSKEVASLGKNIDFYKIYKSEEIIDKVFLKMHTYTIKTQILRQMNMKISEKCFYVDVEFISYPLPYVKSILFTQKDVYIYNIGLHNQSMDMRNMQKRINQHEKVLWNLLSYYKKMNKNDSNSRALAGICARTLVSQYKIYLSLGREYKKKLVDLDIKIKEDFNMVYNKVENLAIIIVRFRNYIFYDMLSKIVQLKYFGRRKGEVEC